ncbi:MAG: ComEC/Rec2 family competence protein [Bacteroidota bacterium]|nr:MAG: ComEC/Rec2 family competence protein [Bacteroidota bacterium]
MGILLAFYAGKYLSDPSVILFVSISTGIFIIIVQQNKTNHRLISSTILFLLIMTIAMCNTFYSVKIPTKFENEGIWQGIICEKPQRKSNSTLLPVLLINDKQASFLKTRPVKALLYTNKDSLLADTTQIGSRVFFKATLKPIKNNGNPNEWNASLYQAQRGYFCKGYVSKDFLVIKSGKRFPVKRLATNIQARAMQQFASMLEEPNALAVVTALTLGNRDLLSDEIEKSYANTGVIHVLAVSGLHVGILYLFLNFLLAILDKNPWTRQIKTVVIVLIIWFYALITGLSPSVIRAAIMFTVFALGRSIKREINMFNLLALAALIMLLINPLILFHVGFQLSFLAVGGIVFFQPHFYKLFEFKSYLADYVFKLLTVTFAAQLITAPVTLYYFNQFPVYFWLANLVLIPLFAFALVLAIAALVIAEIPLLREIVSWILEFCLQVANKWIIFVEKLPGSVIENIHFDRPAILFSFAILILLSKWLLEARNKLLLMALAMFLLWSGYAFYQTQTHNQNRKLIAYAQPGAEMIGIYGDNKNFLIVSSSESRFESLKKYYLKKHWLKMRIHEPVETFRLYSRHEKDGTTEAQNGYTLISANDEIELIMTEKYLPSKFTSNHKSYLYVFGKVMPSANFEWTGPIILGNTLSNYARDKWVKFALTKELETIDLAQNGAFTIPLY